MKRINVYLFLPASYKMRNRNLGSSACLFVCLGEAAVLDLINL